MVAFLATRQKSSESSVERGGDVNVSMAEVTASLENLFQKRGAQDRTGAVVTALRHGIVHL
jgi:hypothetical protein